MKGLSGPPGAMAAVFTQAFDNSPDIIPRGDRGVGVPPPEAFVEVFYGFMRHALYFRRHGGVVDDGLVLDGGGRHGRKVVRARENGNRPGTRSCSGELGCPGQNRCENAETGLF